MTQNYDDFHLQFLAGKWREGSSDKINTVSNPYSGEILASIRSATAADLDEAYQAAAKAQIEWAKTTPTTRSALLQSVVAIFDQRKEEIIDWLIRESGSTRLKADRKSVV